ncbi:MAG: hypothetical protein HY744_02050 [Deltaproteobacteria bacterium]|nr:hypothetical protein [Deltaproteobacteria bacterium]
MRAGTSSGGAARATTRPGSNLGRSGGAVAGGSGQGTGGEIDMVHGGTGA